RVLRAFAPRDVWTVGSAALQADRVARRRETTTVEPTNNDRGRSNVGSRLTAFRVTAQEHIWSDRGLGAICTASGAGNLVRQVGVTQERIIADAISTREIDVERLIVTRVGIAALRVKTMPGDGLEPNPPHGGAVEIGSYRVES